MTNSWKKRIKSQANPNQGEVTHQVINTKTKMTIKVLKIPKVLKIKTLTRKMKVNHHQRILIKY